MTEQFANLAQTTLNGPISAIATTITVTDPANFPTSGNFRIVAQDTPSSTPEIMYVTNVSGPVFTVTRGFEGTSASTHVDGAVVAHLLTAAIMQAAYPNGRLITASGDVTMTATDGIVEMAKTVPAPTNVTLPSSPVAFKDYTVKDGGFNAGTYNITVIPPTGNLDGNANFVLNKNGWALTCYWNGSNWRIK